MIYLALVAFKVILAGCVLAANAYYLLSILAGFRFFSRSESGGSPGAAIPVTVMIPLHGADFNAYENYAELCRQDYPDYQLVFGVRDSRDSSIPIVQKLIEDFPDRDIALVISDKVIGENLKVSNLQNMLGRVKHERIVILDSDIRVSRGYLDRVLAPLADEHVGLVTCLYRAREAPDFGAKLEAVGITAEFAPGVLMAWMLEGVKFALGSTMATTRARLEAIGGFPALADYLADDFMLGNLIDKDGYEVRLSRHVVETAMQPVGFGGMVRHQMRWARSTRISRPMGYLGLILTHGTALALLNVVLDRASMLSLVLLGITLTLRMNMAWIIGVHWLRDEILKKYFWLVPVRDVLSFVIWCLSWVGNKVEWRGRTFEVKRDGKMNQVGEQELRVERIRS
ncbi:MAG TPA: bacteriohopanetetrol glucosamine biosynthesis glycosyltransferase HpnI [Blastocatellia bacterium]|nr:bacteriohopanetetrol glucosamine biosynthesis glycosyltransferase HpnI [Blastocatellia bacterium]